MSKEEKYFKVKDAAGDVFLCPLSALNCVEEDVVGRYAGDIKVVK